MADQQDTLTEPRELAWQPDDHWQCVKRALREAEQLCRSRGARLTPVRKRVLQRVWDSHQPVGAYTLLDQYREHDASAAPPTVYRALGFLMEQGLGHRIASRNAFMGYTHPGHSHDGQFLICRSCGAAAELDSALVRQVLRQDARKPGFQVEAQTIEISGLCANCSASPAPNTTRI